MRTAASHARLSIAGNSLAFESSYNAGLIAAFKAQIPASARRWNAGSKRWLVDATYGQICADLAQQYLDVRVRIPALHVSTVTETRLIQVEYLGACRDRNGESSAFGYADGDWSVIFPETVLREWFAAIPQVPSEKPTYYAVLGVKQAATVDEVRSAYRRLARQWHPDVCSEPNAAEQFRVITVAYQVLVDPSKRRKYEAGLALQNSVRSDSDLHTAVSQIVYRAPLRCGFVLVEGWESVGRFMVSKVIQWEDIVDEHGRVMVSSWPTGATMFETRWV